MAFFSLLVELVRCRSSLIVPPALLLRADQVIDEIQVCRLPLSAIRGLIHGLQHTVCQIAHFLFDFADTNSFFLSIGSALL